METPPVCVLRTGTNGELRRAAVQRIGTKTHAVFTAEYEPIGHRNRELIQETTPLSQQYQQAHIKTESTQIIPKLIYLQ